MLNSDRIFSPICPVFFAGFESNTYDLQRAGWQISAEKSFFNYEIRLALRFEPAGIFALTGYIPESFFKNWVADQNRLSHQGPPFHIQKIGSDLRFHVIPQMGAMNFQPIDCEPQYQSIKEMRFQDLIPFRTVSTDAPEIVIAQENVTEMLDMILKMQDPKQKDIREKMRRERLREGQIGDNGFMPAREITAQIITLAS